MNSLLDRQWRWMHDMEALHLSVHQRFTSRCNSATAIAMFEESSACSRINSVRTQLANTVSTSERCAPTCDLKANILPRPYVSPRAGWSNKPANGTGGFDQPPNAATFNPIELPSQSTPRAYRPRSSSLPQTHHRKKSSADNYYEDVDPRFASPPEDTQTQRNTQFTQNTKSSSTVPNALMPGISHQDPTLHQPIQPTIEHVDPSSSYEDFHEDGQLSPAESEHSNMTSISQRGVNPNWRPDSGHRPGQPSLGVPGRRPSGQLQQQQQQRDVILGSNPDFELPPGTRAPRTPGVPLIQHGQAF